MPDRPSIADVGVGPSAPALASLRLGVWIATVLVFLHCLLWVIVGLLLATQGQTEREVVLPNVVVPLFDPFWAGLVNVALAGLLGWLQYAAVVRRSRFRSYVMGGVFIVLGVVGCMGPWDTPWDATRYVVVGTYLFIGISMAKWGKRLLLR